MLYLNLYFNFDDIFEYTCLYLCEDCICFVSFLINKKFKLELFQSLVFSTKAKTYTWYNCNASPVCFLQTGKYGSRHVLTLLVVSRIDDNRFLSYYFHFMLNLMDVAVPVLKLSPLPFLSPFWDTLYKNQLRIEK